jgi:hypothetical protein
MTKHPKVGPLLIQYSTSLWWQKIPALQSLAVDRNLIKTELLNLFIYNRMILDFLLEQDPSSLAVEM